MVILICEVSSGSAQDLADPLRLVGGPSLCRVSGILQQRSNWRDEESELLPLPSE